MSPTPIDAPLTTDREIISFGGTVDDVGNTHGGDPEVVIATPSGRITIRGITPSMAKEFGLHIFETVYFSITVKRG